MPHWIWLFGSVFLCKSSGLPSSLHEKWVVGGSPEKCMTVPHKQSMCVRCDRCLRCCWGSGSGSPAWRWLAPLQWHKRAALWTPFGYVNKLELSCFVTSGWWKTGRAHQRVQTRVWFSLQCHGGAHWDPAILCDLFLLVPLDDFFVAASGNPEAMP